MSWQSLFPFKSEYHALPAGHRLHYVQHGDGFPTVMLHGNPTWSFMFRNLMLNLPNTQAIALDHLGCGLSDKPQDATYSLQTHFDNLTDFIDNHLKLQQFDLIVHDWGGPVGFAYAVKHPERIRKIVLMNTVAWSSKRFPKAIYLTKCPFLGAFLVRSLNVLTHVALHKVPLKPLSKDVLDGFQAPYGSYADRIAIQRFPQDIPLGPSHQSYNAFKELEQQLPVLKNHPVLACWGEVDFCFPMDFLKKWQEILPNIKTVTFPQASHLLLEDCPDDVSKTIADFLAD